MTDKSMSLEELERQLQACRKKCDSLEKINKALSKGISKFRHFSEKTAKYVCTFSPTGVILNMNDSMARLLSRHPIKFKSQKSSFYDYVKDGERQKLKKLVQALAPDKNVLEVKEKVIRLDMKVGWMHWVLEGGFDEAGRLVEIRGVGRDISELGEITQAYESIEKRYLNLIETMNEGFIEVDYDLHVVYANNRMCEMGGYRLDELVGRPATELIDHNFRKNLLEEFARRRQGISGSYVLPILKKDGGILQALVSPKPKFDADGVFQGSYSVVTDITTLKKIEEELREREKALSIKTAELADANAALRAIIKNREEDISELGGRMFENMRDHVLPYLRKLENQLCSKKSETYLKAIKANINQILSPLLRSLGPAGNRFTFMETQVAALIKEGRSTKEIAQLLGLSARTIDFHRRNLRTKLGLTKSGVGLKTHFVSQK